jgi:hypothetical protein
MRRGATVDGAARCAAIALLVLAPPAVRAQATPALPVQVRTALEARAVTIGSPFRYTIEVTAPIGTVVEVPHLAGTIGAFEVVDFGREPDREADGRTEVRRWFELVTYETGEHVLPGPSIQYRGPDGESHTVAARDTTVVVRSLVDAAGATPPADVRSIKGPVAKPRDYAPLLWTAAALAVALTLAAWLVRRLRRPRAASTRPPRPVHERALAALAELQAAHLIEAGRLEEFYVRLSGIVREYVEGRFRLRAPEMTTEEFLQAAQRRAELVPAHRALLGNFLGEADLVKFARHHPAAADAERALAAAGEFVRSTAPEEPRAAA